MSLYLHLGADTLTLIVLAGSMVPERLLFQKLLVTDVALVRSVEQCLLLRFLLDLPLLLVVLLHMLVHVLLSGKQT